MLLNYFTRAADELQSSLAQQSEEIIRCAISKDLDACIWSAMRWVRKTIWICLLELVMGFLTKLELQTSYRAVRHSNQKALVRCASLQYLDA
eukprot:3875369-Pyramimonas_sp.AAC.1